MSNTIVTPINKFVIGYLSWCKYILYDLEKNKIGTINFNFRAEIDFPNDKNILVGSYDHPFFVKICNINELCGATLDIDIFYKIEIIEPSDNSYYVGMMINNKLFAIISISFWADDSLGHNEIYTYHVGIYDNNYVLIKKFNVDHHLVLFENKMVHNNKIYIWDRHKMIIVDENCAYCIQNIPYAVVYNYKYNAFINSRHQLFRIAGNKFVECGFEFDFWNDTDIPNVLNIVMLILMDMDILPNEICNVIYKQMR